MLFISCTSINVFLKRTQRQFPLYRIAISFQRKTIELHFSLANRLLLLNNVFVSTFVDIILHLSTIGF